MALGKAVNYYHILRIKEPSPKMADASFPNTFLRSRTVSYGSSKSGVNWIGGDNPCFHCELGEKEPLSYVTCFSSPPPLFETGHFFATHDLASFPNTCAFLPAQHKTLFNSPAPPPPKERSFGNKKRGGGYH